MIRLKKLVLVSVLVLASNAHADRYIESRQELEALMLNWNWKQLQSLCDIPAWANGSRMLLSEGEDAAHMVFSFVTRNPVAKTIIEERTLPGSVYELAMVNSGNSVCVAETVKTTCTAGLSTESVCLTALDANKISTQKFWIHQQQQQQHGQQRQQSQHGQQYQQQQPQHGQQYQQQQPSGF